MVNRRRGEVPLTLGGEPYVLCFTLGALAELEASLGGGDVAGLAARFGEGRLRAGDLIPLLGAALRGGGRRIDDADAARLALAGDLPAIADALGAALVAAFGESPPDGPRDPSRDPSRDLSRDP